MKKIKILIFAIMLAGIVLSFLSNVNSQSIGKMKDGFYLGAFNFYSRGFQEDWYKELKLNAMHDYTSHADWDSHLGGFFSRIDSVNSYKYYINGLISNWHNTSNNKNSIIMEREKILRPAYGQRSTYEVEDNYLMTHRNPGYGFDSTNFPNSDITDNQYGYVRVKHCAPTSPLTTGYIAYKLFENQEQTNSPLSVEANGWGGRVFSDVKNPSYNYKWFVKPRMRIDSIYAKNHPNDTVVVIKVTNFRGDTIKRVAIQCIHFLFYDGSNYYYNGRYLETFFNMGDYNAPSVLASDLVIGTQMDALGKIINSKDSKVDYMLYWPGKVEVWVDYIRVDDEWAHFLFTDPNDQSTFNRWQFHNRINDEVDEFASKDGFGYFYSDEFGYNNIPCIAEVNRLVKVRSIQNGHPTALIPCCCIGCIPANGGIKRAPTDNDMLEYLYSSGAVQDIFVEDIYPYYIDNLLPNNIVKPNINDYPGTKRYTKATSNSAYNDYINSSDRLNLSLRKQTIDFAMSHNLIYNLGIQTNADELNFSNDSGAWGLREAMPNEINMQAYLGLAYGAKTIFHYCFHTDYKDTAGLGTFYGWGLVNKYGTGKRMKSYYCINNGIDTLDKFNSVAKGDSAIVKIGEYMYPSGNTNSHLIYTDTKSCENTQPPFYYISDIKSIFRDATFNFVDDPNCINCDPTNKRYWEIGFYNPNPNNGNTNDKSKYFIAVNKRCSPETNSQDGDLRELYIKFDPNQLSGFNNWNLINVISGNSIVFDKNLNQYIDVGNFQPGEGKLFRLAPVMVVGGTFVCNEVLSTAFDCDSTVFNNGYDLTIHCGTTINFKEKGKIVMNGGSFNCNYIPDNPTPDPCERVQLRGKNNGIWEGLSFDGCTVVNLENLEISNVGYLNGGGDDPGWQNCAVSITNCFNFAIGDCIFNMTSPANGINLFFNNFENEFNWGNTYVYGCTFNVNNQSTTPINVLSVASVNTPVKIENCKFLNSNNEGGSSAIFMNGVTGGVLQGNFVHKFSVGVYALSSSLDLFYNTIYSDKSSAVGLYGLSGSTLNLIPNLNYFTGGYNTITNTGEFSKNIDVENSHFNIDKGQNTFNVSLGYQEENNPLHLYGYFDGTQQEVVPATLNCFQIDTNNVNQTKVNVRWSSLEGDPVNFDFVHFSCNSEKPDDYEVFSEAGFMNDTLYKYSGGTGGGFKNEIQASAQTSSFKSACDSICISLRKRNYSFVESRSKLVISAYPDSAKSLDLISKLYFVSLLLDSSGNKIGPLKTYLEGLILNNPGNVSLINRAFYFAQKCKVALRQFQSAMQGFYSIMQQNPYSYEGLVASWDYAATYVLDSLNGHSGGLSNSQFQMHNVQFQEQSNEEMEEMIERTFSTLDTNKFTKQERKVITKNVSETMKSSRQKQVDAVDALQKKSEKGDIKAVVQLKQVKTLNGVIKPKKPNTVIQLKKIISNDINKVFKKENIGDKTKQNILPIEYNLSQNYPNPFNPNTKINYELPKDGKVKLVIYDILGRQIKSLVNNEFKTAGRYTVEFNGSQFASGVYFYRIQVEGGKGYTAVKKMVLVK
jgi:hypothetical protein